MATLGSVTSANVNYTITIPGVLVAPVQLEGFSTDDIFSTERQTPADVEQGVDGQVAAGFMFQLVKQTLTFLANSDSTVIFDTWWGLMQTAIDVFPAQGIIIMPSIKKKFIMVEGNLTGYQPIPDAGKKLKPRPFEITWRQMLPVPA